MTRRRTSRGRKIKGVTPNVCASCGSVAVSTSSSIYRFVAISDEEVALFCKRCAEKVHKFAKGMMKK